MAGKGSLILVLGFSLIMGYIIYNMTSLGRGATEAVSWYNAATASKNLANIGAHVGLAMLRRVPENTSPWESDWTTITDGSYRGGSYKMEFISDAYNPGKFKLRSFSRIPIGLFSTVRDTVTINMRRENEYRLFAYSIEGYGAFPQNQTFHANEEFWGPVHTNSYFEFQDFLGESQWPIFHGKVSAVGDIYPDSPHAFFYGGTQTGVSKVETYWDNYDFLRGASDEDGLHYTRSDRDYYIELNNDEIYIWQNCNSPSTCETETPDVKTISELTNRAIFTEGDLYIQGTLAGELSIGSDKDIIVIGDLKYAGDLADGEDIIGLFTHKDFIIADKPEDRTIHAVVKAGTWKAENGGTRSITDLYLYGSVMLKGPYFEGWRREMTYDTRLENSYFRPPHYPGFDMRFFEIVAWRESVQIPPF